MYDVSRRQPFGSACFFLEETWLQKFEPRGRLGVVLGYGRLESYVVLYYEHYVQTKGEARIVKTRDVRFMPDLRFPSLICVCNILIQCTGLPACLRWCLVTLGRRLMHLASAPYVACGPPVARCPVRRVCPASFFAKHDQSPDCLQARCFGHASLDEFDVSSMLPPAGPPPPPPPPPHDAQDPDDDVGDVALSPPPDDGPDDGPNDGGDDRGKLTIGSLAG